MIKRLSVLALTAVLTAIVAAPAPLEAKDKAKAKAAKFAKMKENREKVRVAFEGEKKAGFTTFDLAYWVDAKKLDDSRWKKQDIAARKPGHEQGIQMHAKWANEASAAPGMTIDVYIVKHLISKLSSNGGTRTTYSMPFDNIGKSVKTSDVEGLTEGFYEDWTRGNKDVIKKQCVKPKKSRLKIPKWEAGAVATDAESGDRVRREWYLWKDGQQNATYRIEIHYGAAVLGKEGLMKKGPEFVKNLKELKDKRVEWPPTR